MSQNGAVVASITNQREVTFLTKLANGMPYLPSDGWCLGSYQPHGTIGVMATTDGSVVDEELVDAIAVGVPVSDQIRIDGGSLAYGISQDRFICKKHSGNDTI